MSPYARATICDENCQVCGEPVKGHLRCSECTILVGPEHIEARLTEGRCPSCYRHDHRDWGKIMHRHLLAVKTGHHVHARKARPAWTRMEARW